MSTEISSSIAVDLQLADTLCRFLRAGFAFDLTRAPRSLGPVAPSQLLRHLDELLRADVSVEFKPVVGGMEIINRAQLVTRRKDVEARSVQEDFEAFKQGKITSIPLRWDIDVFNPESLLVAVRRIHRLYVGSPPNDTGIFPIEPK